jgi:hypothetical protein
VDSASFTLRAARAAAGGAGDVPAAKRAKREADAPASPWCCDVRLFAQHPGSFMLTATLGRGALEGSGRAFNAAMKEVEADLSARWKVTA